MGGRQRLLPCPGGPPQAVDQRPSREPESRPGDLAADRLPRFRQPGEKAGDHRPGGRGIGGRRGRAMPAGGSMVPEKTDVLIVGAGIIGLTLARSLVMAGCDDIVIVEKEAAPGMHASGRNSGVLHAGIYYAPDSLKARSCLSGNFLMRAYCREKGLPLRENGKVIVARDEGEIPALFPILPLTTILDQTPYTYC